MRKRLLLIGRHDYWPGYTPEVIYALPADLWPELALAVDAMHAERKERAAEQERQLRQMRSR